MRLAKVNLSMKNNCGIITIAIGEKFIKQAKYLSLSCMLHTPHTVRAVITDSPESLAAYYDIILPYNPGYGNPFSTKTRLHLYTPFYKTLFLDADSLVVQPLDFCWEMLCSSFIYTGRKLTAGIWYYDIAKIIKQTGFPWIPEFNSGMMLFKNDSVTHTIFNDAFGYMQDNEKFNVAFFRKGMLPDEPFIALAFAKNNIEPCNDYGRLSRTLIGADRVHLNTRKGIAWFRKYGGYVFPMVVHFCGRLWNIFYTREKMRIWLHFNSISDFFFSFLIFFNKLLKKIK